MMASLLLLAMALGALGAPPRVLLIMAHPDDETAFGGAAFRVAHDLQGWVDLAVVTNGEGGYKYSTAGGAFYDIPDLNEESVGRKYLPDIRQRELLCSARALKIQNVFFLGQPDVAFTTDPHIVLDSWWDVPLVLAQLNSTLVKGHYDFVLTMLPYADYHGEHKAATVLAVRAVSSLPAGVRRPVILGGTDNATYEGLPGFPEVDAPPHFAVSLDRTRSFGYKSALDYRQFVFWSYACHKSQGALIAGGVQGMSQTHEYYWVYNANDASAGTKAKALFDQIESAPFRV